MYKLIIAGSRSWSSYLHVVEATRAFNRHYGLPGGPGEVEIVSGTAKGADQLGEKMAREYNLPLKQFPADWHRYGKAAGYRRNEQMAEYADGCIVLWDGQSKGSGHMIDLARKHGLDLLVVQLKMETDFVDPNDDLPWR